MDITIIWVMALLWAASCFIYFSRIYKIARSNRLPFFSPLHRYSRSLRGIVRKLYFRIIILTILFALAACFILFWADKTSEP